MGSQLLEQMQERIMQSRVAKLKQMYPDMDIAQLDRNEQRIMPKSCGGEGKRFTLKGKLVYLEKVQNKLFCTLADRTGLVGVEMEDMLTNIEIRQGQLLCIIARLKCAPDGSLFCEARGITMLKDDDPKLREIRELPEKKPPRQQGRRACRNYWEKGVAVSWARLKMTYKLGLLIPALYLVLEPQLLKRLTLGSLGPTLGMALFVLVFMTGRQVINQYGNKAQGSTG